MGVVLLPCHGTQQGVELSVRHFTYLQAPRYVQNLPCHCHGFHHESGKVWSDILVKLDQLHQRHLFGEGVHNIKEQSSCWFPPALYAAWHKVQARALTLSKRCDCTDALNQERRHIFSSLAVVGG